MFLIETYKSVQGESSFAGLPCIFVRLAGCNLRCSWCDSEYTFSGGYKQSADEVIAAIEALAPVRLVEFTGGEPLLQARELIPLMDRLLADNYQLMIETSGERPLAEVPQAVHKIVDVKCPGSGEAGRFRMENLNFLTKNDEAKFVISDANLLANTRSKPAPARSSSPPLSRSSLPLSAPRATAPSIPAS